MPQKRLMYIELKSGHSGPAWICKPELSKTGLTVYFNGKALKRGQGISSNHFDIETGEEYWISGVKKNGQDRHWAGGGIVMVDSKIAKEYAEFRGAPLDPKTHKIVTDIIETDIKKFSDIENKSG